MSSQGQLIQGNYQRLKSRTKHRPQQNVSAMVPCRVDLKFYLRSTLSFRGTTRASKAAATFHTQVVVGNVEYPNKDDKD
jgi:hypothetical protein